MLSSVKSTPRRPLRAHRKSRHGCQRCKERRVKCDEGRPTCCTCLTRFGSMQPCVFESAASPLINKTTSNAPSSLQVQNPRPHYAVTLQSESNMHRLEFRLFYHYTTCMATTMPSFGLAEVDLLWTANVPQLSFDFDVVLSSILGLAATHLLSYDRKNIALRLSAQYYLTKTVNQLSPLLSRLDTETAEPVMLVAMFVMAQMRARATFILDNEAYQLPIEYIHMHNGIRILSLTTIPFLQKSNISVVLGLQPTIYQTDPLCKEVLPSRIWRDSHSLLKGTDSEGFDPQATRIYKVALSYLNTIYIALLNGEDAHWTYYRQCAMPTQVPMGFVGLLEQQDPRAMAILARFLALMKPCDGIRYYHGCAEYEVEGIASLMPPDWLWTLEWPRQILASDTFLPFDLGGTVYNVAKMDCNHGNMC